MKFDKLLVSNNIEFNIFSKIFITLFCFIYKKNLIEFVYINFNYKNNLNYDNNACDFIDPEKLFFLIDNFKLKLIVSNHYKKFKKNIDINTFLQICLDLNQDDLIKSDLNKTLFKNRFKLIEENIEDYGRRIDYDHESLAENSLKNIIKLIKEFICFHINYKKNKFFDSINNSSNNVDLKSEILLENLNKNEQYLKSVLSKQNINEHQKETILKQLNDIDDIKNTLTIDNKINQIENDLKVNQKYLESLKTQW